MSGVEPALVSQCLDFCKAPASKGQTISFSLTLDSTFYFNLDSRRKATSPNEKVTQKKKKKSLPSMVERNRKRILDFIDKKKYSSLEPPL